MYLFVMFFTIENIFERATLRIERMLNNLIYSLIISRLNDKTNVIYRVVEFLKNVKV